MPTYFIRAQAGTPGSGTARTIWAASTAYAVGDIVAPTTGYATAAARGYVYECTTAGTTGSTEPTWVYTTPDTSTTTSGTAVFTCRNPDTWAKAGMYLDQGVQRATAAGDIIVIDKSNVPTTDRELAGDTTYTFSNHITVISATQNGASGYTYAPMGTDTWIGNSSANRTVAFQGSVNGSFFGLTFRTSGSTADDIFLFTGATAAQALFVDCYFWHGNTGSATGVYVGAGTPSNEVSVKFVNPTFRFASAANNGIYPRGYVEIIGGSVTSAGTIPSILFRNATHLGVVKVIGMDLSSVNTTLVGNGDSGGLQVAFDRCRLASSYTPLATQTSAVKTTSAAFYDCHSGDQHFHYAYYDAYGSIVCSSTIYANDGAAYDSSGNKHCWVVSTTSVTRASAPFVAPLLSRYFEEGNITPYIEILRTGTTTKYTNADVWAEWHAKTTSGSTQANFTTNRSAIDATPSDLPDGIGTSNWTYGGGSAVSMRLQPPSQLSIAEIGAVSAQICCTVPNTIFYIDPKIRV